MAGVGGGRRAATLAAGRPGTVLRGAGYSADGGADPPGAGNTLEAGTPARTLSDTARRWRKHHGTGFLARAQYAVAPDGRFLLNMAADDAVTSPITIVQNWTVGLKR